MAYKNGLKNSKFLKQLKNKIKIDSSNCWIWLGSKDLNGYGKIKLESKSYYAHRVAYLLTFGSIKQGYCLKRTCNKRDCVNPEHMKQARKERSFTAHQK